MRRTYSKWHTIRVGRDTHVELLKIQDSEALSSMADVIDLLVDAYRKRKS